MRYKNQRCQDNEALTSLYLLQDMTGLWQALCPIVYRHIKHLYNQNKLYGCDLDDMVSAAIEKIPQAIGAWDPENSLTLTRYVEKYVRTYAAREAKSYHSKEHTSLYAESVSDDKLTDGDDDGWSTPDALQVPELGEQWVYMDQVQDIISDLPSPQSELVRDVHYKGLTLKEAAKRHGLVDGSHARKIINKGLNETRRTLLDLN